MQQISEFVYLVSENEVVTVEITPDQVNPEFVVASTLGETLQNQNPGGGVPRFQFPISVGAGISQAAVFLCNFPADTSDDAEFDFRLTGSNGGDFVGPIVHHRNLIHQIPITFHVPGNR